MDSQEAIRAITEKVSGRMTHTYRLRDWSIGRQRYWGVPIPVVYDPAGKAHRVPDEHLPWLLPEDVDSTPTGEPPLAKSQELKERTERIFGTGWTPEVETMDTFVDSSWYFLRYIDRENSEEYSSSRMQKEWLPVNTYLGGAEHTTMHLLYSRFWQKALHRLGLSELNEPYTKRINHGMILGPDGNKMSKSKGNIIDPDEQVRLVGADTVKMYLAFMGPYEDSSYPWDPGGIAGLRRFLERVNGLSDHITEAELPEVRTLLHKTIKKVSTDIVSFKFNTAISALMVFLNQTERLGLTEEAYCTFLTVLAPFAPHLTEELWSRSGREGSIHQQSFPQYDETLARDDVRTIGVQINGRHRGEITLAAEATEAEATAVAYENPDIAKYTNDGEVKKVIYVPGRILNLIM
jgi:leucyl-tRNA synthetase